MLLTLINYLRTHPSTADLDTSAESIQTFFSSGVAADQKFANLCENEAHLLLTRSTVPKEVQPTFHHTSRKDPFLQRDPFLFGLMGLGTKAYAVRTDPKLIFKRTHQRRVVPTMTQFTSCLSLEDFKNLALEDAHTQFVWNSTVLPSYLYKDILSMDDWRSDTILLHILKVIHKKRQNNQIPRTVDLSNVEETNNIGTGDGTDTTNNITQNDGESEDGNINTIAPANAIEENDGTNQNINNNIPAAQPKHPPPCLHQNKNNGLARLPPPPSSQPTTHNPTPHHTS